MKRLLVIALCSVILVGCGNKATTSNIEQPTENITTEESTQDEESDKFYRYGYLWGTLIPDDSIGEDKVTFSDTTDNKELEKFAQENLTMGFSDNEGIFFDGSHVYIDIKYDGMASNCEAILNKDNRVEMAELMPENFENFDLESYIDVIDNAKDVINNLVESTGEVVSASYNIMKIPVLYDIPDGHITVRILNDVNQDKVLFRITENGVEYSVLEE